MEKIFRLVPVIVLFGLILAASACLETAAPSAANATDQIIIAVTIPPQKEFVERVGGDRVHVIVMVPPGADPHTYEPTASQMIEVSRAAVYIEIGSGIPFERTWIQKIYSLNTEMQRINSSSGLTFLSETNAYAAELRDSEGAGIDPHVWLSPRNAKIMVGNIEKGLSKADPSQASLFRSNADLYQQELEDLDRNITKALSGKTGQYILVYHPSWGYFCRDYGINQLAIEDEGKEPSPSGLERILRESRARNITVIFASPEFPLRSADAIASQIGGKVVFVSPLEEHYVKNMQSVAGVFANND